MAQFDLYRMEGAAISFLLDLQDEMLAALSTRVVAPLVTPEAIGPAMKIVNPKILVDGTPYILMTHLLAAIPTSSLGVPVGSAKSQRDKIIAALDLLFTGI
jgi:toxin CcdB